MVTAGVTTRDTILVVARHRFAEQGFAGTSLAEIADDVGIRTPSLFHHFPSKTALYRAVLLDAFDDWFAIMDDSTVRLARWEALVGGQVLVEELASALRPLFERAVVFLEREMDAGLIRRCDAAR